MRISTNLVYQQAVTNIQRQQAGIAKTQQQLSLGTRIVSPSDDPVAASRVLVVEQARATNEQYGLNRDNARTALSLEENTLASITTLLQNVHTTIVYAGNPSLTNNDRQALGTELRSRFAELLSFANTTDGEGLFLFSGYQGTSQPFTGTVGTVQYNGDQGQRLVQVSATRQLAVSDSGSDVFLTTGTGNDAFYEHGATANRGTGTIGQASVNDASALSRTDPPSIDSYSVRFTSATAYEVYNTTTGAAAAGNPYVYDPSSGATITADGVRFTITGAPVAGDEFSVTPSKSVFRAFSDLITAVETPVTDPSGNAELSESLKVALQNFDRTLDKVLSLRADVGARLQELDSLDDLGDSTALQHQKTLSGLQDLDYAAAISDFTRQQLVLEAAQRSFTRIAGLSLFDYL